jgi:chemotaxis protein methyltransferase CheR
VIGHPHWSAPAVGRVAALVKQRTGLALPDQRWPDLEALLPRAARHGHRSGDASDDALLAWLTADRAAFDQLVSALTVKETYFFRDPGQFAFIAREVMPAWRTRGHVARILSAGCATGEEAYSLAMLCAREQLPAQITGTDISTDALVTARAGRFKKWSVRLPDSAPALPFLRSEGDELVVDAGIRARVGFHRLNLASEDYPRDGLAALDLVLCRNVLIYLDKAMLPAIIARLYASLAEGGWLLTAASDPPLAELAPFEVVVAPEGVLYRRATSGGRSRSPVFPGVEGGGEVRLVSRRRPPVARPRRADVKPVSAPAAAPSAETAAKHYGRALALAEAGKQGEALDEIRRALYLDRSLAIAYFTRGTLLRALGDRAGARQAFRRARACCLTIPPDALLPLGDGVTAGYLTELADVHLRLLPPERGGHR